MNISGKIESIFQEHMHTIQRTVETKKVFNELSDICNSLVTAYSNGKKVLLFGNGGSAADAQHIATELVVRFYIERRALDAEALNVNTSTLTAISNDLSFDHVFSRQIEAKAKPGDILIGLTTSGTSCNVLEAFKAGKTIGCTNICLTGEQAPDTLDLLCDAVLRVPSRCTPRIQECHILIGHILCEYVEKKLFGDA